MRNGTVLQTFSTAQNVAAHAPVFEVEARCAGDPRAPSSDFRVLADNSVVLVSQHSARFLRLMAATPGMAVAHLIVALTVLGVSSLTHLNLCPFTSLVKMQATKPAVYLKSRVIRPGGTFFNAGVFCEKFTPRLPSPLFICPPGSAGFQY